MRRKHNTLLAGVAALALLAGGGIAAAQSPQGQTKAGAGMSAQGTTQAPSGKDGSAAAGMEQHTQTTSPSGRAASPAANTSRPSMAQQGTDGAEPGNKSENRSAQTEQRNAANAQQSAQNESAKGLKDKSSSEAKQRVGETSNKTAKSESKTENKSRERIGATEKTPHERLGAATRSERKHSRISEKSEHGRARMSERTNRSDELKGLQGNTSLPMQGGRVQLTSKQRSHIRDAVIDARGAPRVGRVDFDVTVGTVVPRDSIHVVRVPETLVRIDPQWHGYLYFIVEDQVVIVNPRDMQIVAVLDV